MAQLPGDAPLIQKGKLTMNAVNTGNSENAPAKNAINTGNFAILGISVFSGRSIFGILAIILHVIIGPFSPDLILLTALASTPAIWIGRNTEMLFDFISYLRGEGVDQEGPSDIENHGGIWNGN